MNNEFGDFQTPLDLAEQCLRVIGFPTEGHVRVLEPTCGKGSFLQAAGERNADSERFGIEINPEYTEIASQFGTVKTANVFEENFSDIRWANSGSPLFVIGNPPWVTAAELRRLDSSNLPKKENFKGVKGLDAMLGGSNFDVCEYIILKALNELRGCTFRLGMLCKTHVARNVIVEAHRLKLPLNGAAIYPIDAQASFNASVDACWFTADIANGEPSDYVAEIRNPIFDESQVTHRRFGVVDGVMVSDVDRYLGSKEGDGTSPYVWRSGLKHDAASVFELKVTSGDLENKAGEKVEVEGEYLFPLLKSTDVFRGRHKVVAKNVIVPQMVFGEETSHLKYNAPKLWKYLNDHANQLDSRKSSIYRNRPRFSVFGHGDYTFAPFKVAISGLHKEPHFVLITPLDGKPVVLDDTCYFIPFEDATEAAVVTALLNSDPAQSLLQSLVFWDSKRPITKKLLARLDIFGLPFDSEQIIQEAKRMIEPEGMAFEEGVARSLLADGVKLEPLALF